MRTLSIGLALALIALPAWAQMTQEQYFWCASREFPPDQKIKGCTIIIQSGVYGGTSILAMAYNNRAWAYHLKGEDAKGLPDAEQSVAIEPTASHFETRAEIREKLGQRDKAIADYRAALKINPSHASSLAGLKRLGVAP